jgi:hypothetical protein
MLYDKHLHILVFFEIVGYIDISIPKNQYVMDSFSIMDGVRWTKSSFYFIFYNKVLFSYIIYDDQVNDLIKKIILNSSWNNNV